MAYTEANLLYYKKYPDQITDDLNISLLLALLDYNPEYLKYIKNQTSEMIYLAFEVDPTIFKFVDFSKVSIQFLEKAIKIDPYLIQYVYSPSPELVALAILTDFNTFQFVEKYMDENMYEKVLSKNGLFLEFVPSIKQTEKMVMVAISENVDAYNFAFKKTKNTDLLLIGKKPEKFNQISEFWDELIEPLVDFNPELLIKFLDRPYLITNDLIKKALIKNPKIFKLLPEQTMEIKKFAVEVDVDLLELIPYDKELVAYALHKNGLALKYVKKQDLQVIKKAVLQNYDALQFVKIRKKFFIEYTFDNNGLALKYITNPTEQQCIKAIDNNPLAIQFVPKKLLTPEMQIKAIDSGGKAVAEFISTPLNDIVKLKMIGLYPETILEFDNITEEMYINAFKIDGELIRFFDNWEEKFNETIVSAALSQNGKILEFLKNKKINLVKVALKQYPLGLRWINNQTIDIIHTAIKNDIKSFYFADKNVISNDNPLKEVILKIDSEFLTRKTELTYDDWVRIIEQQLEENK